ncbi:MAG: LysM domain-containing protein, partial [Chloroflexi bacterium]|nr:LysM domain-containing protein [Chloroflexota bacterium]
KVYRGSIGALLIGSIVAVWLLVLPPAAADQDGPPAALAGVVQTVTVTPTPEVTPVPGGEATPAAGTPTATPEPTETPTPTPTETVAQETYTVQSGDTLFLIASRYTSDNAEIDRLATAIAQANGITDPSSIQVGQVLIIPPR